MYSTVICGNAIAELKKLPAESINMCYTCPTPFSYQKQEAELFNNQIGYEPISDSYLSNLIEMFRQVYRVLKKDGSLYVMMADYHIDGELQCIPERFVTMMSNLWYYKSSLIWHRSENNMFQEDTKRYRRDHEFIYFFTKDKKDYYFNNKDYKYYQHAVIKAPYVPPKNNEFSSGLPYELIKTPIYCSTKKGDIVLDPLAGTGTTGFIAKQLKRNSIMIEIDPVQCELMQKRLDF